jgi:hypothetical protein
MVIKMGQYHKVYNVDKKEFLHAHRMNMGLKMMEQIGFEKSMADALFLLVANSNGRGGGDAEAHPEIGRWAGDRIVVQGDYAKDTDNGFIGEEKKDYADISKIAADILNTVF